MLDEQGLERQVAQNKEFAPTAICRGKFSTLFNLLITRVTKREPTMKVIIHWLEPFQSWSHNLGLKIC